MSTPRPVLSLGRNRSDEGVDTEVVVPVGIFDVQLPARQFLVHHKVAEVGQVSLTTEFLLRLLHSIDGMSEVDVARFFDFDASELAFVVDEPEVKGFIHRSEGRLWLTDAGHALFKGGTDKPQIYEVNKRYERVGFDLLSLAPCDREALSPFERALPELPIQDPDLAANASKYVPENFRRFYGEIASRRSKDPVDSLKRALYSVDEVFPEDRFPSLVSIVAMSNARKPGDPEPVLDSWRTGHEISDRNQVVHAVGAFLDNLKVTRSTEDNNAYELLREFAPDYMKDYVTRQGVSVPRFFKETAARAGELRADRQTVGIIGSLYSPENSKRVSAAINYAAAPIDGADDVFMWLFPNHPTWGASREFVKFVDKLVYEGVPQVSKNEKRERDPIMIGCGKPAWHLSRLLSTVFDRPDNGSIPSALEMLLIPQRMVAMTVHSSILENRGFPVPLGLLSFDSGVIRRAHEYLETQLPKQLHAYGGGREIDIRNRLAWRDAAHGRSLDKDEAASDIEPEAPAGQN